MPRRVDTTRATRRRRTAAEARREILEAAERRLRKEGPEGLRVQAIARDVGVTDAAVHHHFGSRQGLAEALLRHAGRRLRDEVAAVAATAESGPVGLQEIAARIAYVYDDLGYARLSLWLGLLDRQPRGAGMFQELVTWLQAAGAGTADDARFAVAALNVVLWAEAFVAPAMLRSVGGASDPAAVRRLRRWVVRALEVQAGIAPPEKRRRSPVRAPRRRPHR